MKSCPALVSLLLFLLSTLPSAGACKSTVEQLDFFSPHPCSRMGEVEEKISLTRKFDWGKQIVIGEAFPENCGVDDARGFLRISRAFSQGSIGHLPNESLSELAELKKTGMPPFRRSSACLESFSRKMGSLMTVKK